MGYALIGIAEKEPDWKQLHADVCDPKGPLEFIPIEEGDGKHYLGISIPSSKLKAHDNAWEVLENVLGRMRKQHGFQVFDLYGGFFVDEENLPKLKQQLLG